MEQQLFQGGEITLIWTRSKLFDGQYYELGFAQGQNTVLFAAVDRQNPNRVTFIPLSAVDSIEVEYEHKQEAGEAVVTAGAD